MRRDGAELMKGARNGDRCMEDGWNGVGGFSGGFWEKLTEVW
jgi:hypothetical protein